MPKLSNARRFRRQHNLSGYCVNQTLRKVSEEDIQEQASSTSNGSLSKDQDGHDTRPLLKRREPSTCLSDLCLLSPVPSGPSTENQTCPQTQIENDDGRTLSPAWGHFVDVILDDDSLQSSTAVSYKDESQVWPVTTVRAHSPYEKSARKRLRISSPQRPNKKEEMDDFILQDPSSLHDALSRLSV